MFEGEFFIRILPATFPQMFFKFMLHSQIISEIMTGPEDSSQVDLQAKLR